MLTHFYYPIAECDKMTPKSLSSKVCFLIVENREINDCDWPRPKIKRMSNGNIHFMAFQETAVVTRFLKLWKVLALKWLKNCQKLEKFYFQNLNLEIEFLWNSVENFSPLKIRKFAGLKF